MNQAEYRCAVMHELVHIAYGHTTCQPPLVEARVRAITARLLIPFDGLVESWRWATTIDELADELHVTRLVLEDRLDGLTFKQQQRLGSINAEIGKTL
jgi:predicted metal-dependent peptidase